MEMFLGVQIAPIAKLPGGIQDKQPGVPGHVAIFNSVSEPLIKILIRDSLFC